MLRETRLVLGLAAAMLVLHLAFLPLTELSPHEAYYWQYSRHLDLSFHDHPPMSALWIAGTTAVFGQNEFGVRFGGAVAGLGITLFLYFAALRLSTPRAALAVAAAAQCLPLLAFLSVSAGPDIPLAFFWSAATWAVVEAVFGDRPWAWAVAGLAAGGALLSKYTAAALLVSVFIFLATAPSARPHLRRPGPWIFLALALLSFTPVLLWNARHDWASFAFQFSRRADEPLRLRAGNTWDFLREQVLIVTPPAFAAMAWCVARARPRFPQSWLPASLAAPLWLGFLAVSLTTDVKRHWPGMAYLGATLALAVVPLPAWVRSRRWIPWTACLLAFAATVGAAAHAALVPPWKPQTGIAGWKAGALRARELARPGEFVVGVGRKYRVASEIAFYGDVEAWSENVLGRDALAYDDWQDPSVLEGKDALLVYDDPQKLKWDREAGTLEKHFDSIEELETLHVSVRGTPIRTFVYLRGRGYRR